MHSLDSKIRLFCSFFHDRLARDLLNDINHYINNNERGLAFETLCDHICEYDVHITQGEYDCAVGLCHDLKIDVNDTSIVHFKIQNM